MAAPAILVQHSGTGRQVSNYKLTMADIPGFVTLPYDRPESNWRQQHRAEVAQGMFRDPAEQYRTGLQQLLAKLTARGEYADFVREFADGPWYFAEFNWKFAGAFVCGYPNGSEVSASGPEPGPPGFTIHRTAREFVFTDEQGREAGKLPVNAYREDALQAFEGFLQRERIGTVYVVGSAGHRKGRGGFRTYVAVRKGQPVSLHLPSPRTMSITDRQIEALLNEAATAGDMEQVAMCKRALDGSERARQGCAKAIASGNG
jgi:hypothetical protein